MNEFADLGWQELLARLEQDLSHRAWGGRSDDPAWAEVRRRIEQYAGRMVGANVPFRDDLEDVVQAVLVKLQTLATVRELRAKASPLAYLIVMIRHAVVDLARVRRREESHRHSPDLTELSGVWSPSGEEIVAFGERVEALKQALALLSKDDRELILMRFWHGLSLKEIATRRGMQVSATGTRLFRILRRLRAQLSVEGRRVRPNH